MAQYTIISKSPSYPNANGTFYHSVEKRWIKAKTISCAMQTDGRFMIVVEENDFIRNLTNIFEKALRGEK
jgi:hypothetical protein